MVIRVSGFAVAWLCLAAAIAVTLGSLNIPRLVHILRHEGSAVGVVTGTDCRNHNTVRYSFEVGGQSYRGSGPFGVCSPHRVGSPIVVYYSTETPTYNVADHPVAMLVNEIIPISFGCLVVPPFIIWRIRQGWAAR